MASFFVIGLKDIVDEERKDSEESAIGQYQKKRGYEMPWRHVHTQAVYGKKQNHQQRGTLHELPKAGHTALKHRKQGLLFFIKAVVEQTLIAIDIHCFGEVFIAA